MRTVLDLLNPPCPEAALGEDLVGFDLDSPRMPELEALFDRFRRNEDLPVALEQGAEDRALEDRWVELRHQALGPLRHIDPRQVPAALLVDWIRQSAHWTNLARSDVHRALGLWVRGRTTAEEHARHRAWALAEADALADAFGTASRRSELAARLDAEEAELQRSPGWQQVCHRDALAREGLLGPFEADWFIYPAQAPGQTTLRASDGVVALWERPGPPPAPSLPRPASREAWLAVPGMCLEARVMEEGELLEFQDHPWKLWRNGYLQVHGNGRIRFDAAELTEAQRGYLHTFFDADRDHWPASPEPGRAPSRAGATRLLLEPLALEDGETDDWRLVITPMPSPTHWPATGTYLHASLHEAARQAGWTRRDAVDAHRFQVALNTESLAGAFALYPGNDLLPLTARCAAAPCDETILEALRRMRVAWGASGASGSAVPTTRHLGAEVARLRDTLRVLPAVQPVQHPGGQEREPA